MTEELDRKT